MQKLIDIPFHERIEAIRKRAGISHDQLSHRAWTSSGYTHRICAGKAKPSRDMVIRLCLSLNLDVVETDLMLVAAGHIGLLEPQGEPQLSPCQIRETAFELDTVATNLR
jgi:hypothetical protein